MSEPNSHQSPTNKLPHIPSESQDASQEKEEDTVMGDGPPNTYSRQSANEAFNVNAHTQNATVDPQSLQHEPATPESTPEGSYNESESSSSKSGPPEVHRRDKPTGVCYDIRMKLHANADFSANPHHPEDPRRIDAIMSEFKSANLVYKGKESDAWLAEELRKSPNKFMWRIKARHALEREICLCHSAAQFFWAKSLDQYNSKQLRDMTEIMDAGRKSLYVGNLTFEAALISAGGAIESCKQVVNDICKNAFAVIRPPGHHAERDDSMGFCIFNNVPIAVRVCMADYPEKCRKVLILDWDVHHGNGIQNMFYEDPNVLYISLHVYQDGKFYPGPSDDESVEDGGIRSVGAGLGIGKNVNIGWHDQGMGDGDYMAAFQRIVMPIAAEFNPDLVVVSAGFDAAAGDELGGCYVSPPCYAQMTYQLMSLASGKVVVCLEGGYNLKAISISALAVAKTLMGEPPERFEIPPLQRGADHVLRQVRRAHAPYWACMRDKPDELISLSRQGARDKAAFSVDDAICEKRRRILSDDHRMVTIYIQRDVIHDIFKNQVLKTPDFYRAKKILIIIHDPAIVEPSYDPLSGAFSSSSSSIQDPITKCIDGFRATGYDIMDINVPDNLPPTSGTNSPTNIQVPPSSNLEEHCRVLLCYLWDNFISLSQADSIVLMGIGSSFPAIHQLLLNRDCKDKVACVIGFLNEKTQLKVLRSHIDESLYNWYKNISKIWVDAANPAWDEGEMEKRIKKKRFGLVAKGGPGMLNSDRVRDSVVQFVEGMVNDGEEEMSE